ncbi:MAG: OmpA family protein [Bacteroidales bacterium]|nr:OmpA family protein [Bacteroidales bacterium]
MKKLFTIVALALIALSVNAQDFQKNWYLQLQGGVGYTVGETGIGNLLSPAAAINLGWNFAPAWTLRFSAQGWQGKGAAFVSGVQGATNSNEVNYKFNYLQGTADIMLNLASIGNYDFYRVFNPYVFIGLGIAAGLHNEAPDRRQGMEYRWNKSKYIPMGKAGIGADFRLSDVVSLGLEYNVSGFHDKFNSKKAGNPDWQHDLLLGLKFDFGRKAPVAPMPIVEPVVYTQPEPAPAPVVEQRPAPQPQPRPAPRFMGKTDNVFFLLDQAIIRPEEQVKIDEIVKVMKENPTTTISVTGYADVETGTAPYNLKLSQQRAQNVADAIIAAGIAPSRVTVDAKGSSERPFSLQAMNRVAICIVSPAAQ